ncbi:OmpA family protein [Candidatus Halobeggiatoa sp. HSG11]|nr:OmpA family protein [Candidatus Halobeggiatoa sp. HSG11]
MIILKTSILIILLNLTSQVVATEVCEQANSLLYQAYDLYSKQNSLSQQKQLLKRAIQICPMPEIHNALAFVLESKGEYQQAIKHYKLALKQKPDLDEAQYDLAELYYKQSQFALSLSTYLNICNTDADAKIQIQQLLKEQRYAIVDSEQTISKENLLLLYDYKNNNNINKKLLACGVKLQIQPVFLFYNFKFQQDILHSTLQLDEIAETLRQLYNSTIKIHAHTDTFANIINRDELNLKLSQKQAEAIANALVERGISIERIQTTGHGYHKPIAYGISPEVARKNTRIEIVRF